MERTPRTLLLVLLVVAVSIYGACALVGSIWKKRQIYVYP